MGSTENHIETPGSDDGPDSPLQVARAKTGAYAKTLLEIIKRHASSEQETVLRPSEAEAPQPFRYRSSIWLRLMAVLPFLLLLLFGISFFWDFNGISLQPFGAELNPEGLLRILSISGLIGFLTNWVAITMLFKPVHRRPILGHGLIPAQKDRIAKRLALTISENLINPEIIKQKIHESEAISRYREEATQYIKNIIDDPVFRSELKLWVVQYVDEMIADRDIRSAIAEKILVQIEDSLQNKSVEKVVLKAYSFVRGQQMQDIIEESLSRLPASVEKGLNELDNMLDRLPVTLERHSETIEKIVTSLLYKLINRLDVQSLVEDNLRQYDEQRLSGIIRGATNEQLRYIQYLGALLGTVGGFIIWEPLISLLVLGLLTGLVLATDIILFRIGKR